MKGNELGQRASEPREGDDTVVSEKGRSRSLEDPRARLASALAEIEARDRRIEQLVRQLEESSARKNELERVLTEITSSKSWLLTAPYRYGKSTLRRVFPLVRMRRYSIDPCAGRNMNLEGGKFHCAGESATLELKTKNAVYPSGWALVRVRLECAATHMFFSLLYSTGHGFVPHQKALLLLQSGRTTTHLVRLPPCVDGFRFDPFDAREPFSLPEFSIQEAGSLQVLAVAGRKYQQFTSMNPRNMVGQLKKVAALVRQGGLAALAARISADASSADYDEWVRAFDTLSDRDRAEIRAAIDRLPRRPLISVIMPTFNTGEEWLRRAVDSVRAQLYPEWELCIADDASTAPHVRRVLDEYAAIDTRIKVVYRTQNGHISAASNSALELAVGEYVALLDHDDELTEHALYMVADALTRHPDAMIVYSDEDKKTSHGKRFNPYFKPDWNPDLLLSQNYVCHLSVYRTDLVRQIGGFRKGFEGAQDWDLLLRAADAVPATAIHHIPHVLYHWRVIEGSTAQATAYKPYVMEAQRAAVMDHLRRRGIEVQVDIQESISQLRVHFPVPSSQPLVSLIIPTRDRIDLLERCVSSILTRSTYTNLEILIVDNGSEERETLEYFAALTVNDPRVRVVRDDQPFNFSRINNRAAERARGSILGFLNNDLEVITDKWLAEMVSHVVRPEIGAVGARLLYPNGLLQHGGVILGIGGVAGHNHKGIARYDPGYFNRAILLQNLSAVTAACLLIRREVFDQVGGFDEGLEVAFNDVDLCLRVRSAGYRIAYTPYAELYHYESATRGYETTTDKFLRFEREIGVMKKRWGANLREDCYYNPNLTLVSEDFRFAYPPRAEKPWRRSASSASETSLSFSNTEKAASGRL